MKISCDVIRDLLPLYAEDLTSEESNKMIAEHIAGCSRCADTLSMLKSDIQQTGSTGCETAPLKLVKEGIKKRKLNAVAFGCLCVFLITFTVFSYMTKPSFVSYEDSNVKTYETIDGQVYVSFGEGVKSYKMISYKGENGGMILEIEGWNSPMDKILGSSTPEIVLPKMDPNKDTVYYCDLSTEKENMHVVYGIDPNPGGEATALPRLFLQFYLIIALAMSAVIGVAWLALRKKKKISTVFKYAFFAPLSYALSNLLLSTDLVSFAASRGFVMNVIGGAAIYGIIITGWGLIKQRRQDEYGGK